MLQKLAILGSTGSIGKQTLDICRSHPKQFSAEILTAGNNADLLIEQALEFIPDTVVITNEALYEKVQQGLKDHPIKVFAGEKSVAEVAGYESIDTVVLAMVGFSGLLPAISAIKAKRKLALANKEVLVIAGEIISKLSQEYNVPILPIDSEHSAIFQCLSGERLKDVEKIILTASGGPFRGFSKEQLKNVSLQEALSHPVWKMGSKITIDSATMMNKGFEIIEARWLFNLPPDKIEVLVHPQSIIHSMVQFIDGSIKAQMSKPDMRLPILYALSYPERLKADFQNSGLDNIHELSFEKADPDTFKHLQFAYDVMKAGGGMPCVLNAANEIAVDAFLKEKISFYDMQKLLEKSLSIFAGRKAANVEDLIQIDHEVRNFCLQEI
ncbi:MAG: 1-deoxy-D-xylulose-5-phosphate reductoisomerase [Bacteroidales bacterium]|nr:1-deoxy-D-xylulose-5-phosphate reductoisomerase [Bacteroidales bacterium]